MAGGGMLVELVLVLMALLVLALVLLVRHHACEWVLVVLLSWSYRHCRYAEPEPDPLALLTPEYTDTDVNHHLPTCRSCSLVWPLCSASGPASVAPSCWRIASGAAAAAGM